MLVAAAVAFIVGAQILARHRPAASRDATPAFSTKKWAVSLLPFTLIAIVSTLNLKIGILLLGLFDTDSSIGAFQVASSGATLITTLLVLVNMVIAPQVVRFWTEQDTQNLQLLSRQSARAAFVLAVPIAIAYFLFGEQILDFLFGEEYAKAAYWPLVILAAGHLINVFVGSVGLLLIMSGYEMDTLRTQGAALLVTVVACIALIPAFGAIGAALGTTIGLVTWNVLLAIQVKRRLGIRPSAW
jgi:O-antigen/teichoic acid export membrane protein